MNNEIVNIENTQGTVRNQGTISLLKYLTNGELRCQAMAAQAGHQCKRKAVPGCDFCNMHGGTIETRPATQTGQSMYNLGTLSYYMNNIKAPGHTAKDFTDEINLLRAQLQEIIVEADKYDIAIDRFGNIIIDKSTGEPIKKPRIDILQKASAIDKIVNSIVSCITKLYDFQKDQKNYINVAALEYLIRKLSEIVNRFVTDANTRRAISTEIQSIRIPDELR